MSINGQLWLKAFYPKYLGQATRAKRDLRWIEHINRPSPLIPFRQYR